MNWERRTKDSSKLPWDPGRFESQAPVAGIAFELDARITEGWALLVCDPHAACVIMSETTAGCLSTTDDSALWHAIAKVGPHAPPMMLQLPAFGGDGSPQPVPPDDPAQALVPHARARAQSFETQPDDGRFGLIAYADDIERDESHFGREFYRGKMSEVEPDSINRCTQGYYQRFLAERAPQVPWIDELREATTKRIASEILDDTDYRQLDDLRIDPRRGYPAVTNNKGGRIAQVHPNVGRPPRDFLVVADELDRPAAIQILAAEGIRFPFKPKSGWLNGAIRAGDSGWVYVTWTGEIAGREVELELARLRSRSGRLTVFAREFVNPIKLLLRRAGLVIKAVQVEVHPDDPECLFGVDLFREPTFQRPRKLRPRVKGLIPPEWAEQLESSWNPEVSVLQTPSPIVPTKAAQTQFISPLDEGNCRLCDGVGEIQNQRLPFPVSGYCIDCCRDAFWGAFTDVGIDELWNEAAIWALQTLAEIEFGGAPAQGQVNSPPAEGPQADLLILCRMFIPRYGEAPLGAKRKAYSWTEWLAQAGLLAGGVRSSRGTMVTAKDGHLCRSMLERVIDDFLSEHGIAHELEPLYPLDPELNKNGFRADWKLDDGTFVEAFGFPNRSIYVEKMERKIELAARYAIPLIAITQDDLGKLAAIFRKWL